MDINEKCINLLVQEMKGERISEPDRLELQAWKEADLNHLEVAKELEGQSAEAFLGAVMALRESNYAAVIEKFEKGKSSTSKVIIMRKLMVAASILILLTGGLVLYLPIHYGEEKPKTAAQVQLPTVIPPATNRAVLTIAGGNQVTIDAATKGVVSQQGGVTVVAKPGSVLSYQPTDKVNDESVVHTISTPKAGTFQLSLSDGTRVWLNANSSLSFVSRFPNTQGAAREVTLQGEAYFEVTSNKAHPFRVKVQTGEQAIPTAVEVLGTHFNVRAYPADPTVRATLLEGKVRVSHGSETALLRPGQQVQVQPTGEGIQLVANPTLDDVMGWKNQVFRFESTNMKEILEEVGRWYDMSIIWNTPVPTNEYSAIISRQLSLDGTLHMLKKACGLNFVVEGRSIIVLANQ
ncbi:MAG: hypothetical protein DI538_19235 [Azospira oryzae]|nr:MAG: hypothetical protein DI538_19235 [Azospira oryzae]